MNRHVDEKHLSPEKLQDDCVVLLYDYKIAYIYEISMQWEIDDMQKNMSNECDVCSNTIHQMIMCLQRE